MPSPRITPQSGERFVLVEKANPQAIHGLFYTRERASQHLATQIPIYCTRGYFIDKSLAPESFEVIDRAAA